MKINRRDFLIATSAAGLLTQAGKLSLAAEKEPNVENQPAPADKKGTVYTTADKTEYRISATGTLDFKPLPQPLETQICVFVEPKRTFQTFLGIGGALTDASAETFAKLPEKKQQEFLTAYYDKEKGISYGLSDGEIEYIKFTPLEKNYPALCSNENLRELNSTKEWFLQKIKDRPHIETGLPIPLSNVNELILSKEEITADCVTNDLSKTKASFDYTKIAIESKASSTDPTYVLTYNYTVSGGKIIGNGANVIWDLTGVKPGEYIITASVDNGCGGCGKTVTKTVFVRTPDCSQK